MQKTAEEELRADLVKGVVANWKLTYYNNKAFPTRRRQQKKSLEQICYDVQRADQGVSKGATAPLPFH